jgi:hypothetical protein
MSASDRYRSRRNPLSDTLVPLALMAVFVGGWFVLNRWVLPRLGVST